VTEHLYQCGDWINHYAGGHGFVIGRNDNYDPPNLKYLTVLYVTDKAGEFHGKCVTADVINFRPVERQPTDDDWRRFGLHVTLFGDKKTPAGESV
jgi:hypothetical protein